jgi:murein L,D-transpeptidase YcbB/YkuD
MFKKTIALVFVAALLVSLSGGATAGRKKDMEMQGLRNQISVLEAQLQSKDEEINSLRENLNREKEEVAPVAGSKKQLSEVKSRPKIKQIQMALKNAGYNPGPVDGRIGRQTKDALRAFQKANGLTPDGKAGKQTWELLRKYLYQKMK